MNYSLTFCLQKYIISWYHVFRYANNLICIYRGVAQFGRALRSGRRGRGFESRRLDQKISFFGTRFLM